MKPLDLIRLEKAAADHGFDMTPIIESAWLLCRSSQWTLRLWLMAREHDRFALGLSDRVVLAELARDSAFNNPISDYPAEAVGAIEVSGFSVLYSALARVAALARSLPTRVAVQFLMQSGDLPQTTEAERMVVQRVGQQLFREALIDYWNGACAVTGLRVEGLLRASHIKPWSKCASDEERLDVFNGLLLSPHLDALFDGGWVTFDSAGAILVSSMLDQSSRVLLNIEPEMRLAWITAAHDRYLTFHREKVFQP